MLFRGDDARAPGASRQSRRHRWGCGLVATNDVHYHVPERRALHDVVTAIRLNCTVEELGFRRFAIAERHLKAPEEMARLFREHPHAIERIAGDRRALPASRSTSSPTSIPSMYEGGETPMQKLERLTWEGAAWRYPEGVPDEGRQKPSGTNST